MGDKSIPKLSSESEGGAFYYVFFSFFQMMETNPNVKLGNVLFLWWWIKIDWLVCLTETSRLFSPGQLEMGWKEMWASIYWQYTETGGKPPRMLTIAHWLFLGCQFLIMNLESFSFLCDGQPGFVIGRIWELKNKGSYPPPIFIKETFWNKIKCEVLFPYSFQTHYLLSSAQVILIMLGYEPFWKMGAKCFLRLNI